MSRNLDVLRAMAVSFVFIDHFIEVLAPAWKPRIFLLGKFGVLLFFVHTAFVLMMSLERNDRERLFQRFYIRRAFRIYPLSILTIATVLMLRIPADIGSAFTFPPTKELVASILLMQNLVTDKFIILGSLWTLPYEIQMYLALPLIFLVLKRSSVSDAILLWGLSWIFNIGLTSVTHPAYQVLIPCFMSGCVAYRLRHRAAALRWQLWPMLLAVLAIFYLAAMHSPAKIALDPLICLGVGLSIHKFHQIPPGLLNWFSHRVAKYSYGIYLCHLPLMIAFLPELRAARLAVFAILVVSLPVVLFRYVENPMVLLGKRLSGDKSRNPVGLTNSVAALAASADRGAL